MTRRTLTKTEEPDDEADADEEKESDDEADADEAEEELGRRDGR